MDREALGASGPRPSPRPTGDASDANGAEAIGWLAAGIAAQGAILQLVNAGPVAGYQRLRLPGEGSSPVEWIALGVLLLTTLPTLAAVWRRRESWIRRLRRLDLAGWRLILLGLFVLGAAAAPSREAAAYAGEIALAVSLQGLVGLQLILAVSALPERGLGVISRLIDPSSWTRRVGLTAAGTSVLAALLALGVYEAHPHLEDEVAYLLQARLLAEGMLAGPAPEIVEPFRLYLVEIAGGEWYPVVPPGWSAVLAVGVLSGLPWGVNAVLAGLNVFLTFVFVRDLYGDERLGGLAALLVAVSPWHLFLGMSFMNHTLTLTLALLVGVGIQRARRSESEANAVGWAAAAGAAVGALSLVRPLDAVIVAALGGLWVLGLGGRRLAFSRIAVMGVCGLGLAAPGLWFNRILAGSFLRSPIMEYTDRVLGEGVNAYGFGPDRGLGWALDPGPGHDPLDGMVNTALNTFATNVELFGWAVGSLLLPAAFVLFGRRRRGDAHVLSLSLAVVAAYFFYYFSGGPDFGARYWFLTLPALAVLTVRGAGWLARKLESVRVRRARARVASFVGGLVMAAWMTFVPWRAVDKYSGYLDMDPTPRRMTSEISAERALVLVQGEEFPDYASAAAYNPLDFRSGVVFARDPGPGRRGPLLRSFRDRRVWVVAGPSVTGDGYEVRRGPLPVSGLLGPGSR